MRIGLPMMIVGCLGYIGLTFFTFLSDDIDDIRIVTAMSFVCIISFMFGTIIEANTYHMKDQLINTAKERKVINKNQTEWKYSERIGLLVMIAAIIGIIIIVTLL